MTAIEEITAQKAQLAELQAAFDALTVKAADDAAMVAAGIVQGGKLIAERDALKAELAAVIETHGKATAEAAAKVTALESDLAKAKGLLRDPALAVVQSAVPSNTVPAGAEGGASQKTRAQLDAEYAAIQGTDRRDTARLQAEFRKQNAQALGL
jgi:hypothetical protein